MDQLKILKGCDYEITPKIKIRQPTLGEICDYGEDKYFGLVRLLTSTSFDLKVQLLDIYGIDYETVNDYQLFSQYLAPALLQNNEIIFGQQIDFRSMIPFIYQTTESVILCETKIDKKTQLIVPDENGVFIDEGIYLLMTKYLREINGLKRNYLKGGNKSTKKYLYEEDRRKMKNDKPFESILYSSILALVNCSDFPYNFETVWNLPISVFLRSVEQVIKLKNATNLTNGIYCGKIDLKKIDKDKMRWI